MRRARKPWEAIGISRATWYRRGKPTTKPKKRKTMKDLADDIGVSLRTFERLQRIMRDAPELVSWIDVGKLTIGEAERYVAGPADQLKRFRALLAKELEA